MNICKPHTNCRICNSTELIKFLDLGFLPLANNLGDTEVESFEKDQYPLQIMFCNSCGLSQLSVVIEPKVLFSYYPYRSSVNAGYVKHCEEMAVTLKEKWGLNSESLHIDVAGNDGALLRVFRNLLHHKIMNIEPAENLVAICDKENIPCMHPYAFWNSGVAEYLSGGSFGKCDLITATNVMAHVNDLHDFINASKIALKPNGVLVIECPYAVDTIEQMEFTQFYHEHLSYISIKPMMKLCELTGMKLISVEHFDIHCGTVRMTMVKKESDIPVERSVEVFVASEQVHGFDKKEKYLEWGEVIKKNISNVSAKLRYIKQAGKSIAGMCASAKGNTLLCSAAIDYTVIDFICDQTPEKIGKFYPGTGIKIVDIEYLKTNQPDYLMILSWNFAPEIIEKLNIFYKGRYILPSPSFKIIEPIIV